jgi:TRAP-type C4-dicarboxylate transport system permease small subunit
MLERPIALLAGLVDLLIVAAGTALVAIVFYNVVSRYVLGSDLAWSTDLATCLLVWTSFLGAAAAMRRHAHLEVVEIVAVLPPRPRRWLELGTRLVVIAALLFLVVYGAQISLTNMGERMSALNWPIGTLYAACPVSALLMLVFALQQTVRLWRSDAPAAA